MELFLHNKISEEQIYDGTYIPSHTTFESDVKQHNPNPQLGLIYEIFETMVKFQRQDTF
jgi:hypothetical protein